MIRGSLRVPTSVLEKASGETFFGTPVASLGPSAAPTSTSVASPCQTPAISGLRKARSALLGRPRSAPPAGGAPTPQR